MKKLAFALIATIVLAGCSATNETLIQSAAEFRYADENEDLHRGNEPAYTFNEEGRLTLDRD